MAADPWLPCHPRDHLENKNNILTKFEDNFEPEIGDKLPDHEKYLAALEAKLHRLKSNPDVLQQLAAKRELYMKQLLSEDPAVQSNPEEASFEDPIPQSQLLRTILPQKQAINIGEIVEFIKYDELLGEKDCDNLSKEAKSTENLNRRP